MEVLANDSHTRSNRITNTLQRINVRQKHINHGAQTAAARGPQLRQAHQD